MCLFWTKTLTFLARRVDLVFIKPINARIPRLDADLQGKNCVQKTKSNPPRTISRIEIETNHWVEIDPILPNHAPLRDLKEIIILTPRIEIRDCDPHSLVIRVTAGNVGRKNRSLLSVREGEARNRTNIIRQDHRKKTRFTKDQVPMKSPILRCPSNKHHQT